MGFRFLFFLLFMSLVLVILRGFLERGLVKELLSSIGILLFFFGFLRDLFRGIMLFDFGLMVMFIIGVGCFVLGLSIIELIFMVIGSFVIGLVW